MKIAYLMLLHKDPVLLKRTVPILSSENCEFFVHIDRKSDIRQFSVNSGYNIRLCEPRLPVYWSEFSQIEATMLLIQQALDCAVHYDYFVFLQGSTFPLRSGEYIESFLQENREWQFMNLVKMPAPGYPLSKINVLRYTSDKPVRRFAMRALAKLGLAERDYRRYLPKLDAYAGHACWAMSRDACQYVLEFAFSNPHVEAYFRQSWGTPRLRVASVSFSCTRIGLPLAPILRCSMTNICDSSKRTKRFGSTMNGAPGKCYLRASFLMTTCVSSKEPRK